MQYTSQLIQQQVTYLIRLTPSGTGAVATLLLDGPDAKAIFRQKISVTHWKNEKCVTEKKPIFAKFLISDHKNSSDDCYEEIIFFLKNDEQIEIHCHGGEIVTAALEEELAELGAVKIDQNEWQMWKKNENCTRNVAFEQFLLAETHFAAKILYSQFLGALDKEMRAIFQFLEEKKISEARIRVEKLRQSAVRHLVEPFRVAFLGPVNSGKSSLLNAILGFERSIISEVPGTTRDSVSAKTFVQGWPILLIDTAGLRETQNPIEQLGIHQSKSIAKNVDLLLLVSDVSISTDSEPESTLKFFNHSEKPALQVFNKIDLLQNRRFSGTNPQSFYVSTRTGEGIEELIQGIARQICPNPPNIGEPVLFMSSQMDIFEKIHQQLLHENISAAKSLLQRLL